jgi:hypothetical protein
MRTDRRIDNAHDEDMTTNDVECLLCHAVHAESFVGNPSRSWRCTRCGQHWDSARVATVTDYQEWAKVHAARGLPLTA